MHAHHVAQALPAAHGREVAALEESRIASPPVLLFCTLPVLASSAWLPVVGVHRPVNWGLIGLLGGLRVQRIPRSFFFMAPMTGCCVEALPAHGPNTGTNGLTPTQDACFSSSSRCAHIPSFRVLQAKRCCANGVYKFSG